MVLKSAVVSMLLGLSMSLQADFVSTAGFCTDADVDHAPIHRQPPAWPHSAALLCLEGTVVLEFTVGADGRVRDAVVFEATHPGIFDRAAMTATETWLYRPRCEGGEPVEAQQRTALDFLFTEDERANCLPGVRLLDGEALDLVASLGVLYSMLGEWQFRPHEADWPSLVEMALVPNFDGDLGQVERFHHDFVGELLAMAWQPSPDQTDLPMPLLRQLTNPGRSALPPDEADLKEVRRNAWSWAEQVRTFGDRLVERYAALRAEVSMDPELVDVLIHGFLGDPIRGLEKQSEFAMEAFELTEDLLDLLEDPSRSWQLQPDGIRFEDDDDQRRFMRLANEFAVLEDRASRGNQQYWSLFFDYRP